MAKISTLTPSGPEPVERGESSSGVVEPLSLTKPCGEQGRSITAKFYVPILAIRHAYALVDAESEHDALAKGWDTITANQCQWLYETASVEKPFLQLTEEVGGDDFPEAMGPLPLSAVKPFTPLHALP